MRLPVVAGLIVAAALVAGCDRSSEFEEDCVARLLWDGREYGGHRAKPPVTEALGRTDILGCRNEPVQRVRILRIRGVDPSVAIAVESRDRRRYLGLGPGYVLESPRHPMHRMVFGSDDQPDELGSKRCRRPRSVEVRVLETPIYETKWLTVTSARPSDRRFLREDGIRGIVNIDASARLTGLDRGGVPYIERGDRLRMVIRPCEYGPDADPGLRGIHSRVVVRAEQ